MVLLAFPLAILLHLQCCILVAQVCHKHFEIHHLYRHPLHSANRGQLQLSAGLRNTRAAYRVRLRSLPDTWRRSGHSSGDFAARVQHVEAACLPQLDLAARSFDLDRAFVLFELYFMSGSGHFRYTEQGHAGLISESVK